MKDQSRQVIEMKRSASENKAVGWGAGEHIAIPKPQGLSQGLGMGSRGNRPIGDLKFQKLIPLSY